MPAMEKRINLVGIGSARSTVVGIRGNYAPDVITQEELRGLHDHEVALLLTAQTVARRALNIKARIDAGATVEPGRMTFDDTTESTVSLEE